MYHMLPNRERDSNVIFDPHCGVHIMFLSNPKIAFNTTIASLSRFI